MEIEFYNIKTGEIVDHEYLFVNSDGEVWDIFADCPECHSKERRADVGWRVAGNEKLLYARADAFHWLALNVIEEPLNPRAYAAEEFPDTRLKYTLPTLVAWADYCGQISLLDAVMIASKQKGST
jgi:hypothetical protein